MLSPEAGEADLLVARARVIASLGHEIRTPLNGILGMTSLLAETTLDAVQREYVSALGASGEALVALVDDLQDFSRTQAGPLDLEEVDVEPLHSEPDLEHDPRARSAGPVVLVAEDNDINRKVARALLARHGVRSEVACDGLQAVQMVGERDYAAVLMDCQMPALDGYEATARIRAAERDRRLPIIAMTAHAMPGDRERCLAAGMDDYLCKPVRTDELAAVIERWISPVEAAGPEIAPAAGGRVA